MSKATPTDPPEGENIAVLTPMTSPCHVESWSTRVPFVHGRIDLNKIVIGARPDIASSRRDDTSRYRTSEPKRVSDWKNPVANARFDLSESHKREVRIPAYLDECYVRQWIVADELCLISLPTIGRDLDVFSVGDDVIVGDDIAVARNEEARTQGTIRVWELAYAELEHQIDERNARAGTREGMAPLRSVRPVAFHRRS